MVFTSNYIKKACHVASLELTRTVKPFFFRETCALQKVIAGFDKGLLRRFTPSNAVGVLTPRRKVKLHEKFPVFYQKRKKIMKKQKNF